MLPVFIPSRGRYHATGELRRSPVLQLPAGTRVFYVVGEDEHEVYSSVILGKRLFPNHDVSVIVSPYQPNIALVRQDIGIEARTRGYSKFVVMDDDLQLLVRRADDNWQLREAYPDDTAEMLAWIESALDQHAHVGISAREGNNRPGVGPPAELYDVNTRTMRVLAYRTADFLGVDHGRVRVMEDFDVSLQLLEQGKSNACSYYWAQGQSKTNAPGGCSTWRTKEVHEEAARRLADLHPRYVRLRQKQNKTDADGFGNRLEVTVSWKKAYADGLSRLTAARAGADVGSELHSS